MMMIDDNDDDVKDVDVVADANVDADDGEGYEVQPCC